MKIQINLVHDKKYLFFYFSKPFVILVFNKNELIEAENIALV